MIPMMTRKYARPTGLALLKKKNIAAQAFAYTWWHGYFVPITHQGNEQRNQMTSVFDVDQKGISGVTAECESRLESSPVGKGIQAAQQPMQWGHRCFLSHRQELYFLHSQVVPEPQQPEVKYNFSSHEPDDVFTISWNIKNNQTVIIMLKADCDCI